MVLKIGLPQKDLRAVQQSFPQTGWQIQISDLFDDLVDSVGDSVQGHGVMDSIPDRKRGSIIAIARLAD